MRAGQLRHRLEFKALQPGQTGYGDSTRVWATVAWAWGSKEPILGNERFAAGEVMTDVELKMRIRYRQEITDDMRVVHNGVTYDILSIIDVDAKVREKHLFVKKRVE